jgi:hypothetical protein
MWTINEKIWEGSSVFSKKDGTTFITMR